MTAVRALAAIALALAVTTSAVAAEPVRSVHDGDTLTLASGTRVRLHGIDAPELHQPCTGSNGRAWACGTLAAEHLRKLVAGQDVDCRERDRDRYGRSIAVCGVVPKSAGNYADPMQRIDLGREMVRAGLAVAYRRYSLDYARDEDEARRERRGIWGGSFVMPEEWRREHR